MRNWFFFNSIVFVFTNQGSKPSSADYSGRKGSFLRKLLGSMQLFKEFIEEEVMESCKSMLGLPMRESARGKAAGEQRFHHWQRITLDLLGARSERGKYCSSWRIFQKSKSRGASDNKMIDREELQKLSAMSVMILRTEKPFQWLSNLQEFNKSWVYSAMKVVWRKTISQKLKRAAYYELKGLGSRVPNKVHELSWICSLFAFQG